MSASKSSLLILLPLLACDLPQMGDDDSGTTAADDGDGDGGSGSGTADDDGGSTAGSGVDSTDDGTEPTDDTGGEPLGTCASGSLLIGNPYFDGDIGGSNPDGQGLLDDPPLRMRFLAPVDGQLAIDTQTEIWLADDTTVHRIAGDEGEPEQQYQPFGACADVRVVRSHGIAALPNGNIVVADDIGNGLIELSDPTGDCQATPIAGNPEAILDVDISEDVAAKGDVDGPGLEARFYGVEKPVADADGNIYVHDAGNGKIKRVANDADRTVTTIFAFEEGLPFSMTEMGGVLYVSGSGPADFLWAIDLETNEMTELFNEVGVFPEVDSHSQAGLFALTNDGTDLIVAASKGFIFRVSTAGEPLGVLAGSGPIVDFPADLDLANPIPAAELPIRSYALSDAGLVLRGTELLFTNNANGVGFHVWSIDCG